MTNQPAGKSGNGSSTGGPAVRAALRTTTSALAAFGAFVLLVTVLPPRWYVRALAGPMWAREGGVLIVLGAEQLDGQMPGEGSYWRTVYAVLAWREGTFRRVILSGDATITLPMRDFLVCQGVPPDAVTVERRSASTRENALFTSEIARAIPGPWVLLTSDYHMWRAVRAFRKAGLNVTPRPIPDAGKRLNDWRQRWPIVLDLTVESVKIIYYKAHGWI
jgi:uncharacterized SAM-binding protein YcdF (DUF218 family)